MQEQLKNYFTFNYPHYSNNHFNRMNLTAEELHTFDRSAILKKYSRMSLCSVVYTLWNMAQEFVTVLVCHFGIGVARVWSLESTLECSSMYTSKLRLAPSHLLLIQLSIMIQEYGKICDTSDLQNQECCVTFQLSPLNPELSFENPHFRNGPLPVLHVVMSDVKPWMKLT